MVTFYHKFTIFYELQISLIQTNINVWNGDLNQTVLFKIYNFNVRKEIFSFMTNTNLFFF